MYADFFIKGEAMEKIFHPIKPLYNENSNILILGSFPSVKSREQMFFYGHPKNRFWALLAKIFNEEMPQTVEQKRALALKHRIALWDVLASCEISGSSDSSIKNAEVNDIAPILAKADIGGIYVNGKTAARYYEKYMEEKTGLKAVTLPSTSPANASYSFDRLYEAWKIINQGY